jgi:hypothetical protein
MIATIQIFAVDHPVLWMLSCGAIVVLTYVEIAFRIDTRRWPFNS